MNRIVVAGRVVMRRRRIMAGPSRPARDLPGRRPKAGPPRPPSGLRSRRRAARQPHVGRAGSLPQLLTGSEPGHEIWETPENLRPHRRRAVLSLSNRSATDSSVILRAIRRDRASTDEAICLDAGTGAEDFGQSRARRAQARVHERSWVHECSWVRFKVLPPALRRRATADPGPCDSRLRRSQPTNPNRR